MVLHACSFSYSRGESRKVAVGAGLGKSVRPHLKNKLKTEGVIQVVEHLPSKLKALNLILSTVL
jgi:hypothetical protein